MNRLPGRFTGIGRPKENDSKALAAVEKLREEIVGGEIVVPAELDTAQVEQIVDNKIAAIPPSAGGGDMTLLDEFTATEETSLSNLVLETGGDYNQLQLVMLLPVGQTLSPIMEFNGDTANNYSTLRTVNGSASPYNDENFLRINGGGLDSLSMTVNIVNPSTGNKLVNGDGTGTSGTNVYSAKANGIWRSNDRISTIKIYPSTGKFTTLLPAGASFKLFGKN